MTKYIALALGVALSAAGATAVPAIASAPLAQESGGTYYWLHPKLGHVKVDRNTNFMVTAKRPATKPAEQRTRFGTVVTP